jgi:PAS domain S-box-containing protein
VPASIPRLPAVIAVQNPSRIDSLRGTRLLDSPREEAFDRLTRLASTALKAPVAVVSLVDTDRQFFKSCLGLPERVNATRSLPLDYSFSRHAVAAGQPLIIPDAREHPLVRDNPAIREFGLVAYAGIPLLTDDGHALGTLCVLDTVPRAWTDQEVSTLCDLAAATMTEIALRQELAERERAGREREELGRALRAERDRFGSLFEQAPAFIAWVRGPNHVFEGANNAYYQLVGHRDLVGKPAAEAVPEVVAQGVGSALDTVLETGEPFVADGMRLLIQRIPGAEPEERFVNFVFQPVIEADGTRSGIFCHGVDVTSQVRVTEALRASEAHHRLVLDSLPVIVYRAEPMPPHEPIYVNSAVESLGFTYEEWRSRPDMWECRLHPDDRVRVRRATRDALKNATPVDLRYRVLAKDGTVRWFHDRGDLVPDRDGQRCVWQGIMMDITAQREAEEALQLSEARFRHVVANAPGMVYQFVYRPDGTKGYTFVSEGARDLFGIEPETALGESEVLLRIVHPDDREGLRQKARDVAMEAGDFRWQGRIVLASGEERFIEVVARDHRTADGSVFSDGLVVDVTEHRQLEEQLRQAQKMEAVGRLAGGVAHDFNNLLTVIKASTGFLLEELDPADPRREDARQVAEAADRAAGLTRQLLAFSRKQILEPQLLDVNAVVANLRPMLARLIGEDVTVEARLTEAAGSIMADVGQLEQVLINLAVNARDAMPDGGRLTIETAEVTFDGRSALAHARREQCTVAPGSYLMLAVSDTGIGMSPEVRSRVFEPFYTTKDMGKGTGLGLSTVYGIVKQSGGQIWAYSEPGQGTVFKLYFPRLETAATESLERLGEFPLGGTETVLLVEDEESVRQLVRRILERQGYHVLESRNGHEALALATAYSDGIDLILTDVVMPELSGRALVERLTAVRPNAAIIYMSGYTDDDVLRRGMLEPGSRFIQKPFDPNALLRMVREALNRATVGHVSSPVR